MSIRILKGRYQNAEEAIRDFTAVTNSIQRDDAQPERWNPISPARLFTNSSPPSLANFKGTIQTYSFISDSTNQVYAIFELPATYKQGTAVIPVVQWANASGGSGEVVWGLEYIWQNEGKAYSQSTSLIACVSSATATANHYMKSQFASITCSASIGGVLACRLYRDGGNASDNFGANVFLLNFKLLIQHDTNRGSQFQYQKFDGR